MIRRLPVTLLLASAAVVVAAIGWWVPDSPLPEDTHTVSYPRAADGKPAAAELAEPLPPRPGPQAEAPPEEDDHIFRDQDLWAHISDPANSDLPPALFAKLTELGVDVVRADATGQGRDRWPHYWSDDHSNRSGACCIDISISGAGAFTVSAAAKHVKVTVAWVAESADLHAVADLHATRVTELWLAQDGATWSPIRR